MATYRGGRNPQMWDSVGKEQLTTCKRCGRPNVAWMHSKRTGKPYLVDTNGYADRDSGLVEFPKTAFHNCDKYRQEQAQAQADAAARNEVKAGLDVDLERVQNEWLDYLTDHEYFDGEPEITESERVRFFGQRGYGISKVDGKRVYRRLEDDDSPAVKQAISEWNQNIREAIQRGMRQREADQARAADRRTNGR